MKRGGPINRHARLGHNPKRKKAARERDFGPKADYIRRMPCCVCGKDRPSDPHHVKSRGAGGTSKDLVPLCGPTAAREGCHRELHRTGVRTFETTHGIDLTAKAAEYERWWVDGEVLF